MESWDSLFSALDVSLEKVFASGINTENTRFLLSKRLPSGKQPTRRIEMRPKDGKVQINDAGTKSYVYIDNNDDSYYIIKYGKGGEYRVYGSIVPYIKKELKRKIDVSNDKVQDARDAAELARQNLLRAQRLLRRDMSNEQRIIANELLVAAKQRSGEAATDLADLMGMWGGVSNKRVAMFGKCEYCLKVLLRDLRIIKSITLI